MIVNCNKCNKNFNLDNRLIPENGRLLQCGNCNNEWFYIPNSKSDFILQQPEANIKIENNVKDKSLKSNVPIFDTNNYKEIKSENIIKKNNIEKKVDKSKYILNNILIFIITFVAFLILFDSFKIYLSKLFPNIIPILNSLYETLYDLKLFLKDLFN